jgi:4-diphosphocytidyl-2-C-methyl-D-erythritol kinase
VQQQCGAQRGARIRLQKRIPMGGGLGGGSSNAAVTLLGLNRLWQARLSRAELYEMAAELGSDVAFFLEGGTALCTGRGEQVEPVPGVAALHVVLVLPGVHVSTPAVYRALNSALTTPRQPSNNVIKALREGDFQRLVRSLHNDLQEPALRLEERLRSIWEELRRCVSGVGRTGCLLSGSGSSFFVLAQDQESCRRCATAIAAELDLPCVAATSYPAWHTRVEKLIARRGSL